jgi:hypothetical protein
MERGRQEEVSILSREKPCCVCIRLNLQSEEFFIACTARVALLASVDNESSELGVDYRISSNESVDLTGLMA